MRHLIAFAASIASLALAGPAFAQADPAPGAPAGTTIVAPSTEARVPNFLGSTGLLAIPSAYVQGRDSASLFIYGTSQFVNGGVLAGIANRLEVGLGILGSTNGFGRDDVNFLGNAKLNLLAETRNLPAISVGVIDAFNRLDTGPSWFVVGSKYFTRTEVEQRFALKGHIGFGGGIYDEEPFFGAELFFTPNLSAMAEYLNGDINLGGRYSYRGFAATVGLFDFGRLGGGLSYTATFR